MVDFNVWRFFERIFYLGELWHYYRL